MQISEMVVFIGAFLLCALYWIRRTQQRSQPITINWVNSQDKDRRVFDEALRNHLHTPERMMSDDKSIRQSILNILHQLAPKLTVVLLVRDQEKWSFHCHHGHVSREFNATIQHLNHEFIQIIENKTFNLVRLHIKGRLNYWLQLLQAEQHQQTLLVITTSHNMQHTREWHYALDLCSHARTLFQANQQTRYWKQQASLDPLTQTLNRTAFDCEARKALSEAAKKLTRSSLIFLDIDNFKQINDDHGHTVGDQVIAALATLLGDVLRQKDMTGRYGGEEFVILLPETEPVQAVKIAERIRQAAINTINAPDIVTVSQGVATTTSNNHTIEQLIHEADQALYKAKAQGKNTVVRAASCRDLRLPAPQK